MRDLLDLAPPPSPGAREKAARLSAILVWATLAWNLVELVVAMAAGLAASSAALIGFALDSGVESAASIILLWRLRAETRPGCTQTDDRRASRAIAVSLGVLGVLVATESTRQLATGDAPEISVVGIVLTGLSVVVMPWLAIAKRRLAPVLGSRAVEAESSQTMVCAYLSAALLVGLSAHALLGWWWADPLAGVGIAAFAGWEARKAWTAESLADTCC